MMVVARTQSTDYLLDAGLVVYGLTIKSDTHVQQCVCLRLISSKENEIFVNSITEGVRHVSDGASVIKLV